MSYTEYEETQFVHFTSKEDELIIKWLTDNGFSWVHNTVCGNCCGMYEDEYWVNGIGGTFPKKKQDEFKKFAKENEISCTVEGHTIQAAEENKL